MFRRSRFSIRPNVGTAGRTAATPQEAPTANQEATETPRDVSEGSTPTAVTDPKSAVTPSEKSTAPGDGHDQNGEGTSSSAAVQRRKRFSVKPKVAPGRPSSLARTAKSPVKAVSETPVEVAGSDLNKPTTSSQTGATAAPQGLQSPKRRRPSGESRQPKAQPKPIPSSSDSPGPSAVPVAQESQQQTDLPADSGKQLESKSGSQVKEAPPRLPDKVPPSLPEKEAAEISEKAKTLVSSKSGLSLSPSALSLSRLLNDPSDLQRLAKAQKLRELLRQERHKEKKLKKAKARQKEYTLDPAKMTMRDLIRYLPMSNPMTSSLEDSAQENETVVVPPSPEREESPERAQEPEVLPEMPSPREEEEEAAEEEQEEALMVPQVKVAEDGSLIIDEESLTVEVQRAKGPNPAHDRDPIFERGSTTTYSSFRKGTYSKPWSSEETDMFFLAISMVGTDFSMICQLFPHRARSEIKNKFKKEERENAWRIDKAFRERRKLDIEYFSKLLEKILEVQKSRKKLKSLAEKNSPKKHKRKPKAKKPARKLSDVEEEDEEDENELPDLEDEEEGEKENEDLCNEGGTPISKPTRQRKRKTKQAAPNEEPNDKKKKTGEESNGQGEACIPEDAEATLPEDHTSSDMSKNTENVNASKDTAIKPAKLSRGRAPKPLLPLGRKWGKKHQPPSTMAEDTASDKGDESVSDETSQDQVNKDSSPLRQADAEISSEEEDATVQPPRPTRYGRVPKPTKPLTYPGKEDTHSTSSGTTPASPVASTSSAAKPKPKCTAKRERSSKQQSAQESKKPRLVTLRASRSEYSDEDDEKQRDHDDEEDEEEEEEQNLACSPSKDSIAPVFVPASLRSPHPVISEVEETMEELDILANMPDVLGISQDALCPDASCERAQNETGTAEPCEHQLDLLVDVIDFLSSEHTEVTEDESYNEAAQTLLTIGNLTHLPQSAQSQTATQDHTTGATSVSEKEARQHLEEEEEEEAALKPVAREESGATPLMSGHRVPETSETVITVEPQNSTTASGDVTSIKSNEQTTVSDMDPRSPLQSSAESSMKMSPQTKRGRLSKLKPKPNIGRASRAAQPKSLPDTSTQQTAEESNTEAGNLQVTESLSAPVETTSKIPECSPATLTNDISCTEVKLTEELSVSQVTSDQSASENQSHCFSEAQFEPSGEQTSRDTRSTSESSDEKTMSYAEINKTSDASVTDSVPDQEGSQHSAAFVTPVDLPVSQKAESEVAPTCQSRRSRLQKVRPKPNLPQTSRTTRSTPQTAKETVEKDSSQTPPIKELSTTEEKRTDAGLVGQVSSDQSASVNQSLSESPDEPSSRDTGSTSESTDEKGTTRDGTNESSNNLVTSDLGVTESQVGQDFPISQKEESEVASTCATRRGRLQKVKPKPNLAQTSRTARSKPQTTQDPVSHMQLVERPSSPTSKPGPTDKTTAGVEAQPVCSPAKPCQSTGAASVPVPSLDYSYTTHTPTEESSSTVEQKTDVGLNLRSESSEPNVPQSRRVCPKVKPNLGSSTRTTQTKVLPKDIKKPSEQHYMDTSSNVTAEQQLLDNSQAGQKPAGKDSSTKSTPAESEKTQETTNIKAMSSDGTVLVTENQSMLTDSVPGNKSSEKSTFDGETSGDKMSHNDRVAAGPASQGDCKLDMSTRVTESDTQQPDGPTAVSVVQSSENGSTASKINSVLAANTSSIPDTKESGPQPSESDSGVKSQDASQRCSEARGPNQTSSDKSQSTDDSQSELTDSSKSSTKAPQTRRGRLIKPKPNLGRSSRPPQTQQAQNTTQAEAGVDVSVSPKPVSALRTDIQEPVEGAIEQPSNQEPSPNDAGSLMGCLTEIIEQLSQHDSPPNDAGSSQGCVTQGPDNSPQSVSTLSTEGTQSHPSLTMFPDMLSEQVPSDPDEPFFILSLTEIPVCSSAEVVDSAAEPLPYLPVADASVQQQSSLPGPSLAAAGDEESGEIGLTSVKDSFFNLHQDSAVRNPVDPHESTTVQPPKLPENVEDNDETEIPPAKQRLTGNGRRAKLQVKPNTTRKKQASKTLATSTTQDSELPGPSMQTKATKDNELVTEPQKSSGDHVNTEKETPVAGKGPGDSSSGAQAQKTKTSGTTTGKRKPKDFLSPSDPSPGKAASKGPEVKTPGTTRIGSTPTPAASTSHSVAPTPELTQLPRTQVSASQQSDRVESNRVEEEPTNVSQYFFTDIFTEPLATDTSQDHELPGPSMQPKATDATAKAGDEVVTEPQKRSGDCEKETPAGGKGPEDSSSGAQTQTTKTRASTTGKRNSKDFLSPSDPSPGKAASKGPEVKTPRTTRKRSTPAPVASTSQSVAPTPELTQLPEETHPPSSTTLPRRTQVDIEQTAEHNRRCSDPTPSTSSEVSASQQSDCVESSCVEEEPTNVSQYFLSDIFTEVDEG